MDRPYEGWRLDVPQREGAMRAMQYVGYGDPTQLRMADIPVPKPAPEELLVRVIASSVNPVDWKLYNGSLRYLVSCPANNF